MPACSMSALLCVNLPAPPPWPFSVQPGQFIWVTDPANDKVLVPSEVTQASRVTLPGHIMPLTLKGTLLVDAAEVSGGAHTAGGYK